MEWVISILVMLSLIGSIMWVKPSPREKLISEIRLHARKLGFTVKMAEIEATRGKGEMEPQKLRLPAYHLPRKYLTKSEKGQWICWQVFRTENAANRGLPEGWSWKKGEFEVTKEMCDMICQLIEKLPKGVKALESTPIQFTVYWREEGGVDVLDAIFDAVQPFVKKEL
ncbi:MAG: hypothetical protein EA373_03480 [Oceanospirillales bacterium]|nr:MAG: hypothetical protein EA373_03480 [Oceanospirillales bacterium]